MHFVRPAQSVIFRRLYSAESRSTPQLPQAPSGVPLRQILQPTFPLPLKESLWQWLGRKNLKEAENNLLACVGLKPGHSERPYEVRSLNVPVEVPANSLKRRGQKLTVSELEVRNLSLDDKLKSKDIVLVHGYGASKGYFYRNFKSLASAGVLHALDWLGYGMSTRADVKLPKFKNLKDGVEYAEDWFVSSLESWRAQRGIEKFTLVAHSLGAPISCSYASKYPERVEKLVLVSPAAVNRTRYALSPEELYSSDDAAKTEIAPVTGRTLQVPPWFKWMWERHWSPFALVRYTGPWGPKLTSGWTSRRFRGLPERDRNALQVYSYRMFNAKGSGEYMLNYFLTAGSAGRWPLVERLHNIKCPTLWLYGDKDWMDVKGGEQAVERLTKRGLDSSLKIVSNSGHHLYLDNVLEFNNHLISFLLK